MKLTVMEKAALQAHKLSMDRHFHDTAKINVLYRQEEIFDVHFFMCQQIHE
jgi:hypothetical protein